jgi:hypothetical protein
MMLKWWEGRKEGIGRKQSWTNFKVLSRYFPVQTEENHNTSGRMAGFMAEI